MAIRRSSVLLLQFFNSREDEEDCLLFPIVEYIKVGFGARVCVSENIANRDMLISRYVSYKGTAFRCVKKVLFDGPPGAIWLFVI